MSNKKRTAASKSGAPVADDSADAMHRMGRLALESGQHDLAVEWFARAIGQKPDADYLASLGTALQRQGRHDEASKAMDKAIQLRPDDAGLWADFGVLLEAMQRPSDALLCFRHALQLDAKHLPAALRSAVLLQQSGKGEDALVHFDLCDRLRPNHAPTIASRAVVLRDLKRYEDCLAEGLRATRPFKPLINGVLRAVEREGAPALGPEAWAPDWLLARWRAAVGRAEREAATRTQAAVAAWVRALDLTARVGRLPAPAAGARRPLRNSGGASSVTRVPHA